MKWFKLSPRGDDARWYRFEIPGAEIVLAFLAIALAVMYVAGPLVSLWGFIVRGCYVGITC